MLTAKDVNNKKFEQTRPGYSPNEVDDFLREIALELGNYQKEREETAKKIEVLVDSVREYKRDEEALKDALVGAQKQSRVIIAEAQANAEKILADATVKAGDIIGGTKLQLEKEKQNLTRMQQEVSDFKAKLLAMYKGHLAQITAIPDFDDDDSSEETSAPVQQQVRQQAPMAQTSDSESANLDATRVIETPNSVGSSPFGDPINNNRSNNKYGELKFGEKK